MSRFQSIYKIICYLIQRLPVIGLLGYTCLKWRYFIGTFLVLFLCYIILRNLVCMLTDRDKLPCSLLSLKSLILVDVLHWVVQGSYFLCIDISYSRSLFDLMLTCGSNACETVRQEVIKVNEDVEVYVYTPEVADNRGCVLYIHGGGWSYLSAYAYNPSISWMSHYLKMVIVSVEYRLAPEHPFPAALTDCHDSLIWVFSNREKLGIDDDKVFVAGDSAGGNMAAALCLLNKDKCLDNSAEESPLAGQILIYPTLQAYDFYTTGSMVYNSSYFPYLSTMRRTLSMYILGNQKLEKLLGRPECFEKVPQFWGSVHNIPLAEHEIMTSYRKLSPPETNTISETANGYLFPLHDNDLTNMPPGYVLVASADTLKDDGVWYASYLEKFGNSVVLKEAKNCHAFMIDYENNEPARKELTEIKKFIEGIINHSMNF